MEGGRRGVADMMVSIDDGPQVGTPRVEPDGNPVSNDNRGEPREQPAIAGDRRGEDIIGL